MKLTITLPQQQVEEIGVLVSAGKTPNVAAFVKHAVDVALMDDVAGWMTRSDGMRC